MHTATLRQVGGSVMLAIPPAFLDQLRLSARASVGITVVDGRIVVDPAGARPRYTFAELAAQCDPEAVMPHQAVTVDAEWTNGVAAGEELV